jgi:hypothetical protein
MFEILQLFYDILLFKKAPQDVPFSQALTRMTLLAYGVVSFIMLFMSNYWLSAVLKMLADIVLLMVFVRVTLAWQHKSERYQQTFCALLGTDTLLTLCGVPPTAVMLIPSGDLAVLGFLTVVGLILWHWAVIGHILSHALDQTIGFSLGLALLYMMTTYQILAFLFEPISING